MITVDFDFDGVSALYRSWPLRRDWSTTTYMQISKHGNQVCASPFEARSGRMEEEWVIVF